ncbi:MAG: helix-turn-helix transcriptional regulator [Planctomycetota bacterium]
MPLADFRTDPAELIVLSVLSEGASYGYAITKRVAGLSEGQLKMGPGQLYPLLARLEKDKLVSCSWEAVKSAATEAEGGPGRKRKWYRLTAKGRKRLAQRIEAHRRHAAIVERFIGPATSEAGTA